MKLSTVLACDLGGTSFRAALIDRNGNTVCEHVMPSPTATGHSGWQEIDPLEWWNIFFQSVTSIAEKAGPRFDTVEAIAICGITRTQVFLGDGGRLLRNAILWSDTRAMDTAGRLLTVLPEDHPEHGQINAFHPLARLAWLRDEEPDTFDGLRMVIEPKDYLNLRLTGVAAGDPISMARLKASCEPDIEGRSFLQLAGIDHAVLPPLIGPVSPAGPVQPGLPGVLARLSGRPVFCGSVDTWAAVAGLGALRPGFAYNISGTTEVLGIVGHDPVRAEGLLTVNWGDGLYQIGGPGQNGAGTVAWLLSSLGKFSSGAVEPAITDLLNGRRDPQPLLFLPYLEGERTPYWDPNLRGAFIGLNRRHGATDLAWAVLEGVAFLNRIVLERAEAAAGRRAAAICLGGGAAANPVWCQVKADICERPVLVGTAKEPGVLGAALVAWTGLGAFSSLGDAQEALVQTAHRYEPREATRAGYRELFALYRQAEDALRPISHRLPAAGASFSSGYFEKGSTTS